MNKTPIHKVIRANRKIKLSGICKVLIFAAAFPLLGGCVKDELYNTPQGGNDGRVALQASSSIQINTRAHDNKWEAGDAIGIYMLNGAATDGTGNRRYTTADAAETGSFAPATDEQTIYFPVDGASRDFIAYYPYRETLAADDVYTLDVTTQTSQKAINLMGAAKVTGKDKNDPKVAFTFTHKLVKLAITIQADGISLKDKDLENTTVTITKQQTAAVYSVLKGGGVNVTAGTEKDITLYTDGLKAEGIVLPTASTEGMELTFTVPGLNQTLRWNIYSADKSKSFASGSKYLYTITIGKAGLEVTSTVENWTAGNGGGEAGSAE